MNIAALGLDWQPGDRVVSTTLEHVGGLGPAPGPAPPPRRGRGARRHRPGGDDDRTLAALDAAITPATRLVALSHVAWSTGARLPVRAIADLAHARGALVLVDGAQAAGTIPVDVEALGADAYASRPRSGCSAPKGWAPCGSPRRDGPDRADGRRASSRSSTPGVRPPFRLFPDARRFEAGEPLPAVRARVRPKLRLAGDARRARLRVPAVGGRWRRASPTASRPRRRGAHHPARPPRHARHLPDRGLAGPGRPRRARPADLRDRPGDPGDRLAPVQRRVLQHGGRARPRPRHGRRAGRATRPRRCPGGRRSRSSARMADPADRPPTRPRDGRSARAPRSRSAGASSATRRGRSCAPSSRA